MRFPLREIRSHALGFAILGPQPTEPAKPSQACRTSRGLSRCVRT
jgi:hypothetical protein